MPDHTGNETGRDLRLIATLLAIAAIVALCVGQLWVMVGCWAGAALVTVAERNRRAGEK